MPEWSPQQAKALDAVADWFNAGDSQVFRVFGYAGTGKTTLARHFAAGLNEVHFAAFTGKAAMVMRRNGCHGASTIHSLIYNVEVQQTAATETEQKVRYSRRPMDEFKDVELIVIDECSMVDEELAKDLLSFKIPILVLGDPAQLPPVKGTGFFTEAEPDIMLTEIHRQARDNPIIHLATRVRDGLPLERGAYGESAVIGRESVNSQIVTNADQVLIGRNRTRTLYNKRFRQLLHFTDQMPMRGERLVCLRNDKEIGILNGSIWVVEKPGKQNQTTIRLTVFSDDMPELGNVSVLCRRECFLGTLSELTWREKIDLQEFDFGYALTVHKAQGSQWGDVVLFDESGAFRENARRWLYTGLTRASERVTVVM